MSDVMWLADLRRQVANANARTVSSYTRLLDDRNRVAAKLDQVMAKLGHVADARSRATDSVVHARVIEALRTRRFDTLSVKEQRYAARQFSEVSAAEMQQFLTAHPSNWKSFATECFRRWDAFDAHESRAAYTRLLCLAPSTVRFLHQVVRPQELAAPEGPARVARSLRVDWLPQARASLEQLGFEASWAFSSHVLANWMYLRTKAPRSFSHAWQVLTQDRVLEAMLLPPLPSSTSSWFSAEHRPARVQRSLGAYATFVAVMIRAGQEPGVEPSRWSAFVEGLLRSSFGDPRMPPESRGWARLKERDHQAYQRFLELLITEDLTVFFEHAMTDRRRKAFWLRYLQSVRRTVCIVDRATRDRLVRQLAGADEKLSAAISRSRAFTRKSGAQAFCLYFDSIVVVEFSEQGNAAYVYDRSVFEKQFERAIYQSQCSNHEELKSKALQRDRILHMGENWESRASDALTSYGLFPDRR